MKRIIREAEIGDTEAISALSIQLGYPASLVEITKRIQALTASENDAVYVAVEHGIVVGWIHIFSAARLESGDFCEIGGLVVDEGYRGKGIGKMLVNQAKHWCASKEISTLKVRSNVIRHEAHQFYLHEFTEKKEQKVFEMKISI